MTNLTVIARRGRASSTASAAVRARSSFTNKWAGVEPQRTALAALSVPARVLGSGERGSVPCAMRHDTAAARAAYSRSSSLRSSMSASDSARRAKHASVVSRRSGQTSTDDRGGQRRGVRRQKAALRFRPGVDGARVDDVRSTLHLMACFQRYRQVMAEGRRCPFDAGIANRQHGGRRVDGHPPRIAHRCAGLRRPRAEERREHTCDPEKPPGEPAQCHRS